MNYGKLRTRVKGIINRTDNTDDLTNDFLDQGIQLVQREVRMPHMERNLTVDTSSASVDACNVPDDYLEAIAFIAGRRKLRYLEPGMFFELPEDNGGRPEFYSRVRHEFRFNPSIPEGEDAFLLYFGEDTEMESDTDENTFAAIAPDLLIYAALIYAGDYFVDDRRDEWTNKYIALRDQLKDQAAEQELRHAAMAVQPAYTFEDGA